jgi:hypothetical protein
MHKHYTDSELDILRKHYPSGGSHVVRRLINRSDKSIRLKASLLGIKTTCKLNQLDLSHLMDVRSEEAAYVLGVLWGDGSLAKQDYTISLSLKSDDFDEIAHLFDGWCFTVTCRKSTIWGVYYKAAISHKVFHAFLKGMGYIDKSKGSPDSIVAHIPEAYRHCFFRGWFDADGHSNGIVRHQHDVCIAGSLSQNWHALQVLAKRLDIDGRVEKQAREGGGGGSIFRVFGKRSVLRFLGYIYGGKRFGLSRKRANYDRYLEIVRGPAA